MKEYFFHTCLVIEEKNMVRVRVPAPEGSTMRLTTSAQVGEGKFGPDASVLMIVDAGAGSPDPFPFTTKHDATYEPYVEFFFVGDCKLDEHEQDGKVGLLVSTEGSLTVIDPTGALPFSAGQLVEAGRIDMSEDDGNLGPHTPDRVV